MTTQLKSNPPAATKSTRPKLKREWHAAVKTFAILAVAAAVMGVGGAWGQVEVEWEREFEGLRCNASINISDGGYAIVGHNDINHFSCIRTNR